jgi:glycerol uptake facilitator-like aquaporin
MQNMTPARMLKLSAFEFTLTAALLFGVVVIVRIVIGPSPISDALHDIRAELAVVGLVVALLLASLIKSPPGHESGGHMNPAVSFAMWRFGVFPGSAVVPYIVAQLLGSVFGVYLARIALGSVVETPPVLFSVILPGPGWSEWPVFAAEAISMCAIILVVERLLSDHRVIAFTPWVIGLMIGAAIAFTGTTSGGSVNPAREFGPAIASGKLQFLWVYLLAPLAGAALATIRGAIQPGRNVLTHRLSGKH